MSRLTYKTENIEHTGCICSVMLEDELVARITGYIDAYEEEAEIGFNIYNASEEKLNKAPLFSLNHAKAVVEYYLQLKK